MNFRRALILTCTALFALPAFAETELEWGGRLQSDVRGRIESKEVGKFYDTRTLNTGIVRNENIFKLNLGAYGNRFQGIVDIDFVWLGRTPDVSQLADVSNRNVVEPFRIEAHSVL